MSGIEGTTQQDFLLTVNMNEHPLIQNALPGVDAYPLLIDVKNGLFVIYLKIAPGTVLPTHFHTGPVHFYTTKGRWNYVEHPNDVQTAGSYLYEPAGSVHTLMVPADAEECAEGFVVNIGSNIDFTPEGGFMHIMDAGLIEKIVNGTCEAQGRTVPRHIRVGGGPEFSGG